MKNKKKIVLLILIAVFCLNLIQCSGKNIEDYGKKDLILKKKNVYLITKSTESSFWNSVYAGASAASTEYNMNLIFEGPKNEEDYITQNKMIEKAINEKAEVLIISAVDYEKNAKMINNAAKEGTHIIVIDSDVNSDKVKCRIGTDNYQAGCKAAEAALGSKKEKLNIGIVNFDKITENGQSREKGFRETVIKDERVTIVNSVNIPSSVEKAKAETEKMLQEHPEINTIVAFNEIISLGAAQAIEEMGVEKITNVVAFDSHVSCIDFLETGVIDALIVQNPYAMGYLAVENAHKLLNGKNNIEDINTSVTLITKENMYSEEGQRILFDFE